MEKQSYHNNIPAMTTAQRDVLVSPPEKMRIYNTTTNQYEFYNGTSWIGMSGDVWTYRENTVADFTKADFTFDDTWQIDALDLSSLLPVGATAFSMTVTMAVSAAYTGVKFRRNANDIEYLFRNSTNSANLMTFFFIMPIDSDLKVDVRGEATMTTLNLYIRGWST